MCWAHKIDTGPTGQFTVCFQLVGHDFGNGQLGQRFVQSFLQTLQQCGALGYAVVKQSFCFAIGRALERRHQCCRIGNISTEGLQFFKQCRCGIATCVKAHRDRHEFLLYGFVVGLCGHLRDMRSQSARRSVGRDHGIGTG